MQASKPQPCGRIETVIFDDASGAERHAAQCVRDYVMSVERPVLGLATGRTMLPVYGWLRDWFQHALISFKHCTSFNLDEYCGLMPDDPSSFASYMRNELFEHIDMPANQFHLPDARTPSADPAAYDELIRSSGGIGLQLLGIGRNGHIGFNEPGADRFSRTHVVTLTASTRAANADDFPAGTEVPRQAVTVGIATILDARHLVLLATGEGKAPALAAALQGPVEAACPASYLQLHPKVTVICDRAAAAHLEQQS
jgi:glucosamine-6-phosphate deaminase